MTSKLKHNYDKKTSMAKRITIIGFAVFAICLSACSPPGGNGSKNDFPSDTIKMIIPFDAGGSTDSSGRALAEAMEDALGQTVVVENRPGAGGIVGLTEVANSKPDGYTIVYSPMNPFQQPELRENIDFDMDDFKGVRGVVTQPGVLLTSNELGIDSLDQLSSVDSVKYGVAGIGNLAHVDQGEIVNWAGIEGKAIPFDSDGAGIKAVASNKIDLYFATDMNTALGQIKNGDALAIGTLSLDDKRPDYLPDVPTIAEIDEELAKKMFVTTWGVAAPADIEEDAESKLNSAVDEASEDSKFREKVENLKFDIVDDKNAEAWYDNTVNEADDISAALDKLGISLD